MIQMFIVIAMVRWLHTADFSQFYPEKMETKKHLMEYDKFYERHKCCGVYWPKDKECENE